MIDRRVYRMKSQRALHILNEDFNRVLAYLYPEKPKLQKEIRTIVQMSDDFSSLVYLIKATPLYRSNNRRILVELNRDFDRLLKIIDPVVESVYYGEQTLVSEDGYILVSETGETLISDTGGIIETSVLAEDDQSTIAGENDETIITEQ